MAVTALELMGFFLGILGLIGNLVATLLPSWEVTAHIGSNIVTAETNMKGLWMVCVCQSTGNIQCETFNTVLGLSIDLQVARSMMVVSIIFSVLACALSSIGMQCTVLLDGSQMKPKTAGAGGFLFMTAGLLSLIPVTLKTNEIVQSFHNSNLPDSQKSEIGDCLYLGIASSLISLLAGWLLSMSCWSSPEGQQRFTRGYPFPERSGKQGTARGTSHLMSVNPSAYPQTSINMNPTNKTQTYVSQLGTNNPSTGGVYTSRKVADQKRTTGFSVCKYV
ncbi:Claudin-14 [Bagarius yarrelli]|uniref:Claudin-14 n=1 Tax=Bagarius yarrelli TaxID=175774 RepID=A0A556UYN4_BAGYA|nr:Claudin-14 [Bagarius yarrelli]